MRNDSSDGSVLRANGAMNESESEVISAQSFIKNALESLSYGGSYLDSTCEEMAEMKV